MEKLFLEYHWILPSFDSSLDTQTNEWMNVLGEHVWVENFKCETILTSKVDSA